MTNPVTREAEGERSKGQAERREAIENPEAELLREAIRVALPYLDTEGLFESKDYDENDGRRIHMDYLAGVCMAASHLRRAAGLVPPSNQPEPLEVVYEASFVDDYAKLAGVTKREAQATLRQRGEVKGDLQPVDAEGGDD